MNETILSDSVFWQVLWSIWEHLCVLMTASGMDGIGNSFPNGHLPPNLPLCPLMASWWITHFRKLLSSQNNMVVLKTVCCRAALVVRGISSSPCISDRGGLRLLKMPGGFRSPSNDKNWFLCITCDLFSPNVGFLLVLLILKPTYQTLHNHKKGREEPH